MTMTPKIKVAVIATFVLIVFGVSIFTYFKRSGGKEENLTLASGKEAAEGEAGGKTSTIIAQDAKLENSAKEGVEVKAAEAFRFISDLEDFEGTLLYDLNSAIFSLDTCTQKTTEISGAQASECHSPKVSSDKKLIVFFKVLPERSNTSVLHIMGLDGSDSRPVEQRGVRDFDFGPNGDSIIYIEKRDGHVWQIGFDSEIRYNKTVEENKYGKYFGSISSISCRNLNLYMVVVSDESSDFEIWRKDLKAPFSSMRTSEAAELVYKNESFHRFLGYSVSPDESSLLILVKPTNSSEASQLLVLVDLQDLSVIGPVSFKQQENDKEEEVEFKHPFWSLDGKWIYTERTSKDPGLVRFRSNGISADKAIEVELVISNFKSNSGARFVPRFEGSDSADESEKDESEFEIDDSQDIVEEFQSLGLPSEPYDVKVEDFNDNLIYSTASTPSSIISFNTQSKSFADISGKISGSPTDDNYDDVNQKLSSDGKYIGFVRHSRSDSKSTIYFMNIDGSDVRKVVECHRYGDYGFGEENTILYADIDGNLNRINLNGKESSIREIKKSIFDKGSKTFCQMEYASGHIYWHSIIDNGRGFEIWRKNMVMWAKSTPELFYRNSRTNSSFVLKEYKFSANGCRMLIFQQDQDGKMYFDIFSVIGHDGIYSDIVPTIQSRSLTRISKHLKNLFWYTDSEVDWIYAERRGKSDPGLVRFKADAADRTEIEMVVPNFESSSGVSIVPKRKRYSSD